MTNTSSKLKKLYMIGNGFDLWHGIPSNYREFESFVKEHDSDLFDAVETYLGAKKNWSDAHHHHDFQYEVERVVERLSTTLRIQFGK